ncbi:MAG: methyltransferase domain-containing protein [Bacteroidetes bacterium]|nr:methyltransferase domain-containing protein [Bacteroidota bacterium]
MNILLNMVRWIRSLFGFTPEVLDRRFHAKRQVKQIETYIKEHEILMLQIGSQRQTHDAWLNTDLIPKSAEIIFLDAIDPFPIADETFDYIFTEHMIEHISYKDGEKMIAECYRILKTGGKIRISTPNLAFLAGLYNDDLTDIQREYLASNMERFFDTDTPVERSLIVNNFFYSFGHRFIYDKATLKILLEKAGFQEVKFCNIGESEDSALQNLERHGEEIGESFNLLESMVLEAQK